MRELVAYRDTPHIMDYEKCQLNLNDGVRIVFPDLVRQDVQVRDCVSTGCSLNIVFFP